MVKVAAIARYELLMAWRRRSLPILWLVLVLTSLAFSLLAASLATQPGVIRIIDPITTAAAAASGWSVEEFMQTQMLTGYLSLIMLVFNLALVLIGAETIPLDRQFKLRELLDTLPVSRAQYLGGKLMGMWAGVILILLTGGAVSTLTQRLILGSFDLRVLALLWLVMVLPMCLANGAVSVLATVFWGSRRMAVLFSLLLIPLFLLLVWTAFFNLMYAEAWIEPAYLRSTVILPRGVSLAAEITAHIESELALLAGVTLAAWSIAWGWLRAKG